MDTQRNITGSRGKSSPDRLPVPEQQLETGPSPEDLEGHIDEEKSSIEEPPELKALNLEGGEGPDASTEEIAQSLKQQPDAMKDLMGKAPPDKLQESKGGDQKSDKDSDKEEPTSVDKATRQDFADNVTSAYSTTNTDGKGNFGVSVAGPIWGGSDDAKDALNLEDNASEWAPADMANSVVNAPGGLIQGYGGVKDLINKKKSGVERAQGGMALLSGTAKTGSSITKATYAGRQMATDMATDDSTQTELKQTSDGFGHVAGTLDFASDTVGKGERLNKFVNRKKGREASGSTKARRGAVFTRETLDWLGKGMKAAVGLSKFAGEAAQTFATVGGMVAGGFAGAVAIFDYALALRKIHRSGKQMRKVLLEMKKKDISNPERKALRQVAEIANKKINRGALEGTMAALRFGAAALTATGFGGVVGMSMGAALGIIQGAITAARKIKQWGRDKKAKKIATRESRLANRKKDLAETSKNLRLLNGSGVDNLIVKHRRWELNRKKKKLEKSVSGKEKKVTHANMRRVIHEFVEDQKAKESSKKANKSFSDFDGNLWSNVLKPYLEDKKNADDIERLSLPAATERTKWRKQWKKYMGKGRKGTFSYNEFKSTVAKQGSYKETAHTIIELKDKNPERQKILLKGLDIDQKKWQGILDEKREQADKAWGNTNKRKALQKKGAKDKQSARELLLEEYLVEVMGRR